MKSLVWRYFYFPTVFLVLMTSTRITLMFSTGERAELPQALHFGGMEEKKNLVPVFIVSTLVRLSDVRREEKAKEVSAGTCWTLLVVPSS